MTDGNASTTITLRIDRLGAHGDGSGEYEGGRVHLPRTLPGDLVEVALTQGHDAARNRVVRLIEAAPRIPAACPHFGVCGGCALQHVPDDAYRTFKRDLVVTALARRGLGDVPVAEPILSPPRSRRRIRLAFTRAGGWRLGFRARGSHDLVDVTACAVICPELEALLGPLRALLPGMAPGAGGEIGLTVTDTGIDLLLLTAKPPPAASHARLASFAAAHGICRVAWAAGPGEASDPLVILGRPAVAFGSLSVELPPGAFLQPTIQGEARLQAEVRDMLAGAPKVIDLFAGCGTLGLALLPEARRVHLVDGDAAMTAAVTTAVAGLSGRVTAERRDLFKRPLVPSELKPYDAAVLDPPAAGAAKQVEQLAASTLPRIAYISCNPASFARDARILVDGGYTLERVQPVDQFRWAADVELAALFTGPVPGARGTRRRT